jgi:nucleoid-associated protein YgaU
LGLFFVLLFFLFSSNRAQAANYFFDDFSSNFGALSSHTPDTGTSWSQLISNSQTITVWNDAGGYAAVSNNGSDIGTLYKANGTYASADYEVSSVLTYASGAGYPRTLAARIQDANNMYILRYSSSVFQLYKRTAGTWSLLGSGGTYPTGNTTSSPWHGDTAALRVDGNTISGKINGNVIISVTDTDHTAAGTAGMGLGYVNVSTDDSGTGVCMDDFTVASIADTTAPTITSVSSSKANGSYKAGEVVDIDVTFSESVTSTGNVTVTLETGDTDRTCTFSVTNSTTGTCDYTVQAGDNSADLNATISGTIADQAGNPMSNFTPTTGLAANKAIVIDTTAPSTPSATPSAGTYTSVQSVSLNATGSNIIYYTVNGSVPTTISTPYSIAISVSSSKTIKALAVDAAGNESSILEAAYVINLDEAAPTASNISSSAGDTSVTIEWDTNEDSSSRAEYGLTAAYGNLTSETNTSSRVSNHSVAINSLQSCARYYYRVKSKDASNNEGISEQKTFSTSGCQASSIGSSGIGSTVPVAGGTVSLDTDDGTVEISAPNNFYSETATIQINKLNSSSAPSAHSGSSLAEDNFFELLAIDSSGDIVGTFDQPVSFVVSYGSNVESAYDESTLDVYKYASGAWTKKNCALDTTANTLTCSLNSFSTYGVLGARTSSSSDDEDEDDVEIKKVEYSASENSIKIKWKTNIKADSEIKYGTKKNNLDDKKTKDKKEKYHKIVLGNLQPSTEYFFRAHSQHSGNNDDSSRIYSVSTLATTDALQIPSNEAKDAEPNQSSTYTGDAKPSACSYVIEDGDNLWNVAKKVYGDATAYPLIIESNKEKYPRIVFGKLSIGQELDFECENNQAGNEISDASVNNSNKPTRPLAFKWWNPFFWFR